MRDWDEFVKQQEERIGKEAADKWLRSLKVIHFDAGNLLLQATDSFQAMWFEEHVRTYAEQGLRTQNDRKIRVQIRVASQALTPEAKTPPSAAPRGYQLVFDELDPTCTFESFAPTAGSQLAFEVLKRLTLAPDDPKAVAPGTYNPIFLFGPTGVGKSHLLMATAKALRAQGQSCIYARGTTFTEHVVGAIRGGGMRVFRAAYREADALIIDDIQILAGKSATQEELFHTFNTLHVAGKQLILAAGCAPGELRAIEPRLISRFEWGLSCPLEPATQQELRQLVVAKAGAMQFAISNEVLAFLVQTWQSNPKGLIQALEALALRRHLRTTHRGRDPSQHIGAAQEVLGDLVERKKRAALTPTRVIAAVAAHHGIDEADLLGPSQRRECSLPRQISMYLCRETLRLPFARIGEIFQRNHSTVMTSVKQVQKILQEGDRELPAVLRQIQKNLGSAPT